MMRTFNSFLRTNGVSALFNRNTIFYCSTVSRFDSWLCHENFFSTRYEFTTCFSVLVPFIQLLHCVVFGGDTTVLYTFKGAIQLYSCSYIWSGIISSTTEH